MKRLWLKIPRKIRVFINIIAIILLISAAYILLGCPALTPTQAFRRVEKSNLVGPAEIGEIIDLPNGLDDHGLVADDVVDIRRVEDNRLIGEAPELVRHFMEIRGVGIIDVSTMYGAGAIMRSKTIDMVIHLEMWQADKEYDRLGLTDNFIEILGVKVPSLLLPIHPGRNLAVVLEVAARNLRLKQMGYNAANELTRRHMERFQHSLDEE